ncbi:GNAT family N-acetyltransferase [Streptomyces sp. NPDC058231]|uniref:GNAT family N-acetyltransferase n=1 Tax=Streptomyces sp. NPDC058231 TaxID=3346392 RepID=UPI0036E7E04E
MPELMIRPRTDSDMPACVDALATVHEAEHYPVQWPADPARWLTPDGLLGAWVATNGPLVLGHVVLRRAGRDGANAVGLTPVRLAAVARLFVRVGARREGVASRLLEAATADAATSGLRLMLEVEAGAAPAIALYERSGWRLMGSATAEWTAADGRAALVHAYMAPTV